MNKRIKAKTEAHGKSNAELAENRDVFKDFDVLDERITKYAEGHVKLMEYAKKDEDTTEGETNDKGVAYEAVKVSGTKLGQKALSWAEDHGKTDLIPVFDVEYSDFAGIGALRSIGVARKIEEEVRANLVALASERITLKMVDDFDLEIKALEKSNPRPKLKRGHGAENTKEFVKHMKAQDKLLEGIKRRIVNEYSETHTTVVNKFLSSCRIDDAATRKTLVLITVKEKGTGLALAGVYCDVLEMDNEEQLTDLLGEATIKGLKSGTMSIRFSKEGYADMTLVFTIKRGEKVKLEMELVKKA